MARCRTAGSGGRSGRAGPGGLRGPGPPGAPAEDPSDGPSRAGARRARRGVAGRSVPWRGVPRRGVAGRRSRGRITGNGVCQSVEAPAARRGRRVSSGRRGKALAVRSLREVQPRQLRLLPVGLRVPSLPGKLSGGRGLWSAGRAGSSLMIPSGSGGNPFPISSPPATAQGPRRADSPLGVHGRHGGYPERPDACQDASHRGSLTVSADHGWSCWCRAREPTCRHCWTRAPATRYGAQVVAVGADRDRHRRARPGRGRRGPDVHAPGA